MTAEETFLICIEDSHQRYFGQVETFAEEVDADEHIVDALPQIVDYLNAFEGLYLAVDIIRLDIVIQQVSG